MGATTEHQLCQPLKQKPQRIMRYTLRVLPNIPNRFSARSFEKAFFNASQKQHLTPFIYAPSMRFCRNSAKHFRRIRFPLGSPKKSRQFGELLHSSKFAGASAADVS